MITPEELAEIKEKNDDVLLGRNIPQHAVTIKKLLAEVERLQKLVKIGEI